MSYKININPSSLVYDWCTAADLPNDYRVLESQGQYFLIYDYRSAGTDFMAWSYANPQANTIKPFFAPGKLKLRANIAIDVAAAVATVVTEMRIINAVTQVVVIGEGGTQQFWDKQIVFNPPSGTNGLWYTSYPAGSGFEYFTFASLAGHHFEHGNSYKAQMRFLGRNQNNIVVATSDWIDTQHILYVHTKGPSVVITSPNIPIVSGLNEVVVENQSKLDIKFTTSVDSEVRVKTDFPYPQGTGYFTASNSQLISSSGTQHQITIYNPSVNTTNGVRIGIAARDKTYKNIGACGWGLFNYNILFKRSIAITPTINITGQTTVPLSGGYYDAAGTFAFSGIHTNSQSIKLECWQNNSLKAEKLCSITSSTWSGAFSNLVLNEGNVLVKAIATSTGGLIAETTWTGYILKKPAPVINIPQAGISHSATELTVAGNVNNSLGNLKDFAVNVVVYKALNAVRTEVARKQIIVSALSNAWTANFTGLVVGDYVVRVTATNRINQEGNAEINFTVNLTAPSITVTSPALNYYDKSRIVFLSGTCQNASEIKVEIWQNQVKRSEVMANFVFNNTQWSALASALQNGKVDLKVIATNKITNQKTIVWHTFYVDIEAPAVYLQSVSGKDSNNTTKIFAGASNIDVYAPNVTISSAAEDALSGVVKYQLFANGRLIDTIERNVGQPSLNASTNVLLNEGQNKIEIIYTDAKGNFERLKVAGESYFYITYLLINNQGPRVTISNPANGTIFNQKNIIATGTCSDNDGVKKVTLEIYKPPQVAPVLIINNIVIDQSTGAWSCKLQNLVDGELIIKAFGEDNLGKVSLEKATTNIKIDTAAPSIVIKKIEPGQTTESANAKIISYAQDTGSGLARYVAKLEDRLGKIQEIASFVFTNKPANNENSPITTNLILTPGKNIVHLFYYDVVGNVSTLSKTIMYSPLDTSNPVVEIEPADKTIVSSLPLKFTVKAKDLESGLKACNVDFYPLMSPSQILSSTQYYRVGMLPMATSDINLVIPDNKALRIYSSDNNKSYVAVPAAQYFDGDFTVETWRYTYGTAAKDYVLSFGNANGADTVEIGLNYVEPGNVFTNKPWVRISNQTAVSNTVVAPTSLPTGQWMHLAFVLSGNQLTVYLNSKTWFSSTITQTPRAITRTKCFIGVGLAAGESTNGYYSNFRIWKAARAAEEIRQNMSQGINTSSSLVASWRFNAIMAGNLSPDSSGNNRNATLYMATIDDIKSESRRWALQMFSGANRAHIALPLLVLSKTQGFTIEFTVLCQEQQNGGTWLVLSNASNDKMLTINILANGCMALEIKHGNSVKTITSTTPLPLKQKLHLAFVINASGTINLYKNGEVWGTGNGALPDFSANLAFIGKGLSQTISSNFVLYEARMWHIGRTQKEIQQNMHTALFDIDGLPKSLWAYYMVNEGNGNQIKDSSGYGNHANVVTNNYAWSQVSAESPVDFPSSSFVVEPELPVPVNQYGQEYGAIFEQSFALDNKTKNLAGNGTFNTNNIASEHLINGTHTIKVQAVNGDNLQTTMYRTLIFDSVNPSVVISPSHGSTVEPSSIIQLVFNKAMDKASVERAVVLTPSSLSGQWTWEGAQTYSFKSNTNFNPGLSITVSISNDAKDALAGKYVAAQTVTFSIKNSNTFEVLKVSPTNNQTSTNVNSPLIIDFSHPLALGTITHHINRTITVFEAGSNLMVELANTELTLSNNNTRLTCPFVGVLLPNTKYKLKIGIGLPSASGTTLTKETITYFSTGSALFDTFEVSDIQPAIDATNIGLEPLLVVDFSSPVSIGMLANHINRTLAVFEADRDFMVELSTPNLVLSNNNTRLVCPFVQPLNPSTKYKIKIGAVFPAINGSTLGQEFLSYFATEGDATELKNFKITLCNGLNGLAFPLKNLQGKYTNITLRKLLQDKIGSGRVGAIYWYNNDAQKWVSDILGNSLMKTFDWQDGCFVSLSLSSNLDVNLTGIAIDNNSATITLKRGLNLISIPFAIANINNIKDLLTYISQATGQKTIVSYMCRRKKVSNSSKELIGYTYIAGTNNRDGMSFVLDRLGGDAIVVVAEQDVTFTITGATWQN